MQRFFTDADNFMGIIKQHLDNPSNVQLIETGWTNYVFKVKSGQDDYFFRFPRNSFFADALEKEVDFIDFIKPYISIDTPNITLYYQNNRPYTMHQAIPGESLSVCYNKLSAIQKHELAKDICNFVYELSMIDYERIHDISFQTVSNFLDNLSLVSQNNYDLSQHNFLKNLEKDEMIVSHGDFNPGNLILKNGKLVAVIDFAFAGISHPIVDVSRILGRTPKDFEKYMIPEYEKTMKQKIDSKSLDTIIDTWKYVEKQYILYMKQHHPNIKLPDLV